MEATIDDSVAAPIPLFPLDRVDLCQVCQEKPVAKALTIMRSEREIMCEQVNE